MTRPVASRKRDAALLALSIAACIAVCACGIFDRFGDPFAVHNDLTTSVYWMHRMADPALFPNDPVAAYSASRTSPAIEAIYRTGLLATDPVTLSRFFPLLAAPVLAVLGFAIGTTLAGGWGGLFFSVLLSLSSWYFGPGPGTSGELAILVNAGIALALLRRSAVGLAIALPIAALAYPPSAVVGGLAAGAWAVLSAFRRGAMSGRKRLVVLTACAAALGILVFLVRSGPSVYGPPVTGDQMRAMPEFGPEGRVPYFFDSVADRLAGGTTGLELRAPMIGLLVVCGLLLVGLRRRLFDRRTAPAWWFALAGAGMFAVATLLLWRLLAPSKYIVQQLLIALCCTAVAGVFAIRSRAVRACAAAGVIAFELVLAWPFLMERTDRPPATHALAVIASLPRDVVVAGLPETMNWVPVFARRSAYVCREGAEPYYPGYYEPMAERITAMLKAYYAETPEEVTRFCRESGVTHFWVVRSDFEEDALAAGRIYSEPQGSAIARWIGSRRTFALTHPDPAWIVYEDADGWLLAPLAGEER